MRRWAVLLIGLLAACQRDALPPELRIERVVTDLAPPLAPGAAVEGPAAREVQRVVMQPGDRAGGGAPRDAVATPPGTALRFHVDVPPDGVLSFSAGVEGEKRRDTTRSGVEFRVSVDGRQAYRQVINPALTLRHRAWIDGQVDLGPWAGRAVDIVLETRAAQADRPLAGMPGWSRVRLLREERRTRQRAEAGPNVLLLLVDTMRADRLGIYGATPSPTPSLDRFAARGLVFDVAVAQAPWTMPAVASVFTGLYPRSHGAVGPDVHGVDGNAGAGTLVPDAEETLAELAEEVGITTAGVSSNMLISRATNFAQGFETFIELPFDHAARNYAPAKTVNAEFLRWLDAARGLRFFAYLHYMEPHGPYAPPPRLRPPPPPGIRPALAAGWIQDIARAVNEHGAPPPSPAEIDYLRQLYVGDIRSWDEEFGTLVQELEARQLLDHTVVVVMADHGEEFLEHGCLTHGGHLFEESLRIPLVVVGPGVPAGRRADAAQSIDVLPTLSARLGVPAPAGLPGRDLLATDRAGDIVSEIVSGFGDSGQGAGTVALRSGRWKLIWSPDGEHGELYDLVSDPAERQDLAGTSPETAALVARLDRWAAAAPAPPRTLAGDPTLRDRLRRLGYID